MAYYLIGYDIRSPQRLQRVHRKLLRFATPIQYSVFLLSGSENDAKHCLSELEPLIKKEDDLRCYRIPGTGFKARLGSAVLPEGIFFSAIPSAI